MNLDQHVAIHVEEINLLLINLEMISKNIEDYYFLCLNTSFRDNDFNIVHKIFSI